MTDLATLAKKYRIRGMLVGYPGAGKTGAIACLANAGFRLRIIDFDGNLDPLFHYVRPDAMGNIEVVSLEDKMKVTGEGVEPVGKPASYDMAMRLLDQWKTPEVDLGRLADWGPRDVLVVDSFSGLGRAALRRVAFLNNHVRASVRDVGTAQNDSEAFAEKATSLSLGCHVLFTAHLKMIGPKIDQDFDKKGGGNEDPDVKEKRKELQMRAADLVPTKLFPAALGQALPPQIGEHFPILLLCEEDEVNGKVRRVIRTQPKPEINLKLPGDFLAVLPQTDGLLTIFQKLLGPAAMAGLKEAA